MMPCAFQFLKLKSEPWCIKDVKKRENQDVWGKKKKIVKNNNYNKKVGPEYPGEGATKTFVAVPALSLPKRKVPNKEGAISKSFTWVTLRNLKTENGGVVKRCSKKSGKQKIKSKKEKCT